MALRFCFPRSRRIRSRRDFRRIFQHRCSLGNRHLVLYVGRNDVGHSRLGVSAGKGLGNAVVRAREKRRLREAFRLRRHELPEVDMVCVLRTSGHSVAQYEAWLLELTTHACRKL